MDYCSVRVEKMELDKAIEDNMGLIKYIISKKYHVFSKNNKCYEDLIQEGVIGIIRAYNTWNSELGYKFSTYASRCAENEILEYIRVFNKSNSKNISIKYNDEDVEEKDSMSILNIVYEDDLSLIYNSELINFIRNKKDKSLFKIVCLTFMGYTQDEISTFLNIKKKTISAKMVKLRKELVEEFDIKLNKEKTNGRLVAYNDNISIKFNSIQECSVELSVQSSAIRKICQNKKWFTYAYSKKLKENIYFKWIY
ncbi:MAG: sigma-70 family RNA polymerase sigma factor [Bacilli bacterium]